MNETDQIETDQLKIYEQFREDQLAEDNAVRRNGLRMELYFSSGRPQWLVFAGDMPVAQYEHKALAAMHIVAGRLG